MSTEALKDEVYVFSRRDRSESERLNFQHEVVMKVQNGFYAHPKVPTSKLNSIADIGTGTGIWLECFRSQLVDGDKSNTKQFDGFDISSAQFPAESACRYMVQDTLQPFPSEYHEKYDMVHCRFMVLAFRKDQFLSATQNLMQLLKPGGYLQWEELDISEGCSVNEGAFNRSILDHSAAFEPLGMIMCPTDLLRETFKVVGLTDVIRDDRNSNWFMNPELDADLQRWCLMSIGVSLSRVYLVNGQAKDEESAKLLAQTALEAIEAEFSTGTVPNMPLRIVLGRRPL